MTKFKTSDDKEVNFIEYKGKGTLSERYIVKIDEKSLFLKMYAHSDACAASKNTILNEIIVHQKLKEVKSKYLSLYQEAVEINDVVCLLFDDFVSGGREGQSFADLIFDKNYILPSIKKEVYASNVLPLNLIVHIIASTAQQAEEIHSHGIIHRDVSPENIILVNEFIDNHMTRRIILSDFGLATGKDMQAKYLYNQTTTAGLNGTYYGSVKGIAHHRIHSPPNIDKDYETAKPSYDTYNLTNILCLALTSHFIEYWKGKLIKKSQNNLGTDLKNAITSRYSNAESPQVIDNLIDIILKGTDDVERKRYQIAAELQNSLLALQLPSPSVEIPAKSLPCTLPLDIEQFTPPLPPLESLCNQEINKAWQELHRCAEQDSPLWYSQQNRKHMFGHSIGKELKYIRDHPPFGMPKILGKYLDEISLIALGVLIGVPAAYLILELLDKYTSH